MGASSGSTLKSDITSVEPSKCGQTPCEEYGWTRPLPGSRVEACEGWQALRAAAYGRNKGLACVATEVRAEPLE